MSKKKKNQKYMSNEQDVKRQPEVEQPEVDTEMDAEVAEEKDEMTILSEKNAELQSSLDNAKKEYLYLMAEFENFKKRTLKEKAEIIKNAVESAMKGLLPVVDDFERAVQAVNQSSDIDSAREGISLISNKFVKYLEQNGVKAIDTEAGTEFDTEKHEAVAVFPVEEDDKKGKIIDTVQKGYLLNDKVIRHSKVVVGQ